MDWGTLDVLLPGSPGYEQARRPAIDRFAAIRPLAVVRCRNAADVAETISLARRHGIAAVPRGGGHCFAGRSSTEGVVIDTSPMGSVSVDGDTATVGAGARLGDLYDALAVTGRTLPAGCGPTVGIAGLTLGGGLGILGRRYGLTADRLRGAEVVLADGRVVACDAERDSDLFWALRGAGGGHFGVVTSLIFDTVPAAPATAFHLTWPRADAARVIAAWQAWAPAAPDELAASLLVTAPGDGPVVVHAFGAMAGTESDAKALLDGLVVRAATDPTTAITTAGTHRETKRYLAELGDRMAGPHGDILHRSEFFNRPLPADAIEALVAHLDARRVPGQYRELDFTPWAGAYNRVPAHATAFAHRDAIFLLKHAAAGGPAARQWLERSWAAVRPWGSGGVYPNFPDPDLAGWAYAYYGDNYPRLRQVKARYDPDRFFRSSQSIQKGHTR
jgi:FAD/FMN-containing dehydrogenase